MVFTIGNFSAIISSDIFFFLLLSLQTFSDTNYTYVRSLHIGPPVHWRWLISIFFSPYSSIWILSIDFSLKYIYPLFTNSKLLLSPSVNFHFCTVFYSFRISFGSLGLFLCFSFPAAQSHYNNFLLKFLDVIIIAPSKVPVCKIFICFILLAPWPLRSHVSTFFISYNVCHVLDIVDDMC